jgi:hypothetical protein
MKTLTILTIPASPYSIITCCEIFSFAGSMSSRFFISMSISPPPMLSILSVLVINAGRNDLTFLSTELLGKFAKLGFVVGLTSKLSTI